MTDMSDTLLTRALADRRAAIELAERYQAEAAAARDLVPAYRDLAKAAVYSRGELKRELRTTQRRLADTLALLVETRAGLADALHHLDRANAEGVYGPEVLGVDGRRIADRARALLATEPPSAERVR